MLSIRNVLALSVSLFAVACGQFENAASVTANSPNDLSGTYRLVSAEDCVGYTSSALLPSHLLVGGSIGSGDVFELKSDTATISLKYTSRLFGGDTDVVIVSKNAADLVHGRKSRASGNTIVIDDNFASIPSGIFVDSQQWKIEGIGAHGLKVHVKIKKRSLFGLATDLEQTCTFEKI